MPLFRTIPNTEVALDISTGDQTVQTPWGTVAIRADDVILPDGNRTVPVPMRVWRKFFEPVVPAPEPPARVWPDKPFTEWARRDLEDYAREVVGEEPPDFPRKGDLAKWVAGKAKA